MTRAPQGPIFFIGMPRSGTTVAFEAFARHRDLAWPTNYTATFPALPQLNAVRRILDNRLVHLVGKKQQYGRSRFGNRVLPMPDEAYEFWNRYADANFARDYLQFAASDAARKRLAKAVRALVFWQGKRRFAAKLTGPPRIQFLSSAFPEAVFVHVVRDGRAVVHSLLNVGFWRKKGGFTAKFWTGAPAGDSIGPPQADPGMLAALQWREVVQATRAEAGKLGSGQYLELKYEDFVENPTGTIDTVRCACGLPDDEGIANYLRDSVRLSNMNRKYLRDLGEAYVAELGRLMKPCLEMYGYD